MSPLSPIAKVRFALAKATSSAPCSGLGETPRWSRWLLSILVALVFVLATGSSAVVVASPGGADPELEPDHAEVRVAAVRASLTIWRGGDTPSGRKRVARRRAEVDGEATYVLASPARAGQRLILLDYAEVLREEPIELDEIALSTYVAGANERARTTVLAVEIEGEAGRVAREGGRRDLVIELPAGTREVTLRYRVEVPHRYWPMGCVWGRCSLSAALAPLPSEPAEGGVWLPSEGRVITPVAWTLERVRFGAVPSWIPGSEPSEAQAKALAGQELVVTRETLDPRAPVAYPSIFWGPAWHHSERWHRGVRIRVLSIWRRPGEAYPEENIFHPIRDVAGHVMSIASDAIDIAGALGIEPPPDTALTVVQGPVRSDVTLFHPTAVTVSDQYLEIFATKRLAKFHDIQVARAICDQLAYAHFSGRHEASTDLWLTGSVGVALTQLWQRSRELRDEYAVDLLASLTFVPTIDSFLYTGQAAFSSAYFRGSEDEMPVRTHPLFFAHELPTGRRIHEKLADLLDEQEMGEFYETIVGEPDSDPQLVAERAWGRELGWFFDQWLGPYPEVDYAIADVRSSRLGRHRWRHEIVVVRDADRPLIEPVQVQVAERGGQNHYLVWNGEAEPGSELLEQPRHARHTFVLETERRLDSVRLDPRRRLVETSRIPVGTGNRGDNNDPLFTNRVPAKPRFLYTGVGLSVAVSELATAKTAQARINAITAFLAFETGLQRDLRRTGNFLVFTDPETNVGGSAALNLYFGPKRNRQRRQLRLRTMVAVSWLNRGGLDAAGGLRLSESVRLVHDNRKFIAWPQRGHVLSVGAGTSQTVRLDGAHDHRFAFDVGAGWTQLWPLAHHHVLATRLEAGLVFPIASELEYRSLLRGGGIGGLAGFTGNELFGRGVALAALEYRHLILDDLRMPLLNLIWIRSIGGALFGGVESLSGCESLRGWFGADSWYGQVGYGLTGRMQWFGVLPQFIRIEAAVPLGRKSGVQCLGRTFPDYLAEAQGLPPEDAERFRPAFNLNIIFNQPF